MPSGELVATMLDGLSDLMTQATRAGSLTLMQRAVLVTAAASTLGDSYCSLAWGKKLAAESGSDVAAAVIRGEDERLDTAVRALAQWARAVATDPNDIEEIDAADMQKLIDLLRRFFPVILLDLSPGIGLRGTIPRWAFGCADEIVAIATPTRGSLRRAGRMLAYLGERRPEVPITLALNMVPRRPDDDRDPGERLGHERPGVDSGESADRLLLPLSERERGVPRQLRPRRQAGGA